MKELLVVCEELPPPVWVHSILSEIDYIELVVADGSTALERLDTWNPEIALVLVRSITKEWEQLIDRFLECGISACVFSLEPRPGSLTRPQFRVVQ